MSDQGIWYKLWCSALDDPQLDNLPISDFGRWAKFGAFVKKHGTNGVITLEAPCRTLCSILQLENYQQILDTISKFPNVTFTVTGVTIATVTINKWSYFQGDNSLERVRKYRERVTANVTDKKRREEKRREESKPKTNGKDHAIKDLLTFYDETYQKHHNGQRPVIGGEDAKAAQSILKNRDVEVARRMVKSYLENPPDFYRDKGLYGMRHILSAANTLLARREVAG